MYFLWVDDTRPVGTNVQSFIANDLIHIAKTVEQAKKIIKQHGWPLVISFDDQIGHNQNGGTDLAKWILRRSKKFKLPSNFTYRIHGDQQADISAILSTHLNR